MKKNSPVSRSGRFASGPAEDVARYTESISYDQRLWRHDIQGSKAHATMLQKVGLLTRQELREIIAGLDEIAKDIEADRFEWKPELEDVHMNIESALTQRVPAGEGDACPTTTTDIDTWQIHRKPVLNGLINEYVHAACRAEDLQVTDRILTGNRAVSSGRVQPLSGAMLPGAVGELRVMR